MGGGPQLWLYRVVLHLVLPIAVPAMWLQTRLTGKARPRLAERLLRRPPSLPAGGLWLQAVSVGEVELARRLVAELERRVEELPLLVTSTTATGLDLARRTLGQRLSVHACPLDLPGPVSRVLEAARPRAVALVETELWPELMHQSAARGVPVMVVNGRISDAAMARYERVRKVLRPLLTPLERVLVRSAEDGARFARLGVADGRIRVVGNIKYDLEPDHSPLEWRDRLRQWASGRPVLVAGSTMDGEERAVLEAWDRLGGVGRLFLVLAPRHPERFDAVARMLEAAGLVVARRSRLDQAPDSPQVLLVDTIGELARAYGLADAAFVGGSLVATGGHNPLEPAVWGVPVITGPHVHNFEEVYEQLRARDGVRVVDGAAGLATVLGGWLASPQAARAVGAAGRQAVEDNRGATRRTVDELLAVAGLASGRDQ